MKQRVRIKLVQRRQALRHAARKPAAGTKRYEADDHRSRFAAIYAEHRELFKRLDSGATWSGMGREPSWITGKDRAAFVVKDD
jgi:DNA-binding protein H-NS